jgi:hypothetical protein
MVIAKPRRRRRTRSREDLAAQVTGELTPVVIVTDNGPAYRSVGFARFIASRPELLHVRTRHRSPQTMRVD